MRHKGGATAGDAVRDCAHYCTLQRHVVDSADNAVAAVHNTMQIVSRPERGGVAALRWWEGVMKPGTSKLSYMEPRLTPQFTTLGMVRRCLMIEGLVGRSCLMNATSPLAVRKFRQTQRWYALVTRCSIMSSGYRTANVRIL